MLDRRWPTIHLQHFIPNSVWYVGQDGSSVIADIPGLIEGAAQGAGLGIRFLKHLRRTHTLLHLVDVAPMDESDLLGSVREIENELTAFGGQLIERERWLVLNKVDLIDEDTLFELKRRLSSELGWQGPVYGISAVTGVGCQQLVNDLMENILRTRENASSSSYESGLVSESSDGT